MNNPRTILILPGQSLPDIALQEYGTVEGMVFILEANPGLSLGSELTPGAELTIPGRAVVTTPGKSAPAPEPVQAVQSITIYQDAAPAAKPAKAFKTITVQAGQTLADIAMQEYGTFEAAILLLQANPGLSITGPLEPGQQLVVFTNYTIKLVQELVKVEPFASQLQNLLAQWAALVRPEPGVVTETDPVFTSWLATFEPFSGNYADLNGKPTIPAAQVQSDYTQADSAQVDYIKNKPQTKQAALTDNSDFPASYVGHALKLARVRADESGVEFVVLDFVSNADARITNWNTAYSWGNHAAAGYLTAITKAQVEAVLVGANITSHGHNYQAPLTTSDLFLDTVNKRVGIGTNTPAYKFDVRGTALTDKISTDIGLNFNPVTRPGAFTASLAGQGAGNIPAGTHYYYVAYKTAIGQTELSTGSGGHTFTGMPGILVTTTSLDGKVNINVTASSDPRVTGILIYRDVTNGTSYSDVKLVATISNVTQTYLDNIADTSRTGTNAYSQENTTCMAFSINGYKAGTMGISTTLFGLSNLLNVTSGSNNSLFGSGLGAGITTGGANVLVGSFTGNGNINNCVYIGVYTGYQGTARTSSVGVGSNSLYAETVGTNTAVGYCSGFKITSGTYNLFGGYNAGNHASQKVDATNTIVLGSNAYSTESNSVVIGNTSIVRTYLRGYLNVSTQTPASATAAGNAGDIAFDDNYIYRCTAANTWKRSPLTTW